MDPDPSGQCQQSQVGEDDRITDVEGAGGGEEHGDQGCTEQSVAEQMHQSSRDVEPSAELARVIGGTIDRQRVQTPVGTDPAVVVRES